MGTDTEVRHPVVFFDGVCNLCNASVQFIIKRDKSGRFRFSSLQSEYAKKMLPSEYTSADKLQSLVLLDKEIMTRSSAAIQIAGYLGGVWAFLKIFRIIPPVVRDIVYDLIARNRYRLFGKQEECMLPAEDLKYRFID